jgi:hypothetical protein
VGGVGLSSHQEDTGISVDANTKTGVIRLRGPEEGIAAAMLIITEVCGLDKKTIEIPLDPRAIPVFVGKGGASIKKVRRPLVSPPPPAYRFFPPPPATAHSTTRYRAHPFSHVWFPG